MNNGSGSDNNPELVLRNHGNIIAPPLTVIFIKSLKEGVLPIEWKMTNAMFVPKSNPPVSIKNVFSQIH